MDQSPKDRQAPLRLSAAIQAVANAKAQLEEAKTPEERQTLLENLAQAEAEMAEAEHVNRAP